MSITGEIENATQEIKRLRAVLATIDLDDPSRKKVECDIAYELKRLEELESATTKIYA